MHSDDHGIGRIVTRRELVALLGASAAATIGRQLFAQSPPSGGGSAGCVVLPQQTEGPYFVDEKLERSDIRRDPATGLVTPGLPLDLRLVFSRVSAAGCAPVAGAVVDIWQCDTMGVYSDATDRSFDTKGKKFLRGYQVTDRDGVVRFTTVYPGWYPGRAVHVHFKVRSKEDGLSEFTSQFYFDEAMTDRVHARQPYAQHQGRRMSNEQDGIYRNGGSMLILPVAEAGGGYAATFNVGMQPGSAPPTDPFGPGRGRGGPFGRGGRGA